MTRHVALVRGLVAQGLVGLLHAYRQRIDETAHVAEERRPSAARYQRIVETAQEGIWEVDADALTTLVNPTLADMLGYTVDEMRGRPLVDFVPANQRACLEAMVAQRDLGRARRQEMTLLRKDGAVLWVLLSTTPVVDGDGRYTGALAMVTDIGDRKRADEALRTSEARFRALSEHATDLVLVLDAVGRIAYASPSHARILGYTPEDMGHMHALDLVHPDDQSWVRAAMAEDAPRAGSVVMAEFRLRHADGSWRTLEVVTNNRLHDPAVRGIVINSRDITARARAEEVLHASEARFRHIVATAQEGVWVCAPAGRTTYVNDRMAEMLGYTADDMVGRSITTFMDEEMRAQAEAGFRRRAAGIAERFEFRFRRKDGAPLWAIVATSPLLDAQGVFVESLGMVSDITERVRAEQALRESEDRYHTLFANHHTAMLLIDPRDGAIVDANPAACDFYGYDLAALRALAITDLNVLPPVRVCAEMEHAGGGRWRTLPLPAPPRGRGGARRRGA